MIQQMQSAPQADSPRITRPCQWKALHLLSEAWAAARSEEQNVWQFAVEIDQLRALGLSHTDLRCLLCWGYLEHARECITEATHQRLFQPLSTLVLPKRACFVLTTKGWKTVSELGAEPALGASASTREPTALPCPLLELPRWDERVRQLWWGRYLIKEFRRPAVNQELVLAALEEEDWPPQIDDPLPPTAGIDPKVRLHDTIKALNHHHLYRIIHFGGDGRGRGIHWSLVERG